MGFLPLNKKLRKEKLEYIKNETKTVIIYEAPHKLKSTLEDLKEILEKRKVVIARELTKIHEEFIRGTIDEILEKADSLKGEIVLIIEGNKESNHHDNKNKFIEMSLEKHYEYYEKQGFSKKEIIKKIAKDRGLAKNEVYQHFIK